MAELQREVDAVVSTVTVASVPCRHCGEANQIRSDANPDWQCAVCERWQDTIACPTCGQPARISLLAPEVVPAPHEPVSAKKGKDQ